MKRADLYAVLALFAVWLTFYWPFITPNEADQASLVEGDYFGQFVTFGAYQYDRLTDGEIPRWNPYNNGGLPFIADTQAAPLYPPRLLTFAVSHLSGAGFTYATLQTEVALHVLLYSLLMYLFIRRLMIDRRRVHLAGVIAGVTVAYGGWTSSYPQLQVAVIEAAVWLPLALLGVLEATRTNRLRLLPLSLSGFALGLSWMAGHPQTSWFATYLIVAYLAFRVWHQQIHWSRWILGLGVVGVLTVGITAVHLLPGVEYLARTMRTGLSFTEKGGGFVFNDVSTFLYPRVFWSPLYFGVVSFGLAVVALLGRGRERWFWFAVGVVVLALSFGANSAAFRAAYNILPGLSFFRGQERAAYLVANAGAILAGWGAVTVLEGHARQMIRRVWLGLVALAGVIALGVYLLWFSNPENYDFIIDQAFFTALMLGGGLALIYAVTKTPRRLWLAALAGLIAFELVSVNVENNVTEPIPASERTVMEPGPLVETVQADTALAFRVDGGVMPFNIGIPPGGNTGSLHQLHDIRGISPLFLDGPHAIIQRDIAAPFAWEVFAVKYVFSANATLPVASEVIAQDRFADAPLYLHRLEDPRPFAHLVYDAEVIEGDAFARELLTTPGFNARTMAILASTPDLNLPEAPPEEATATVTAFEPERFVIQVESATDALLSVAHVDYPGWQVTVAGTPVEPIRAYGAVVAVPLPAGTHTVIFRYDPLSYRLGAGLSLVTWAGFGILGLILLVRKGRSWLSRSSASVDS